MPRGFVSDDLLILKDHINNQLGQPGAVETLEMLKKRSLWGYRGDSKPLFLKITICDQRTLPRVRGLFERGELGFRDIFNEPVTTYESNIAYTLRFMIDTKVSGVILCYLSFERPLTLYYDAGSWHELD